MPVCLAVALLAAASSDAAALDTLVDRFDAARAAFAQADLAATLAPDYSEVSPVGEVDDRAKVLSFYAADRRQPAPAMTASERTVTPHGTWGIVTQRLSFTVPRPDGAAATRSVRVRYVAAKTPKGWQLVSAQYTAIPMAR